MTLRYFVRLSTLAATSLATTVACSGGAAPQLDGLTDQVAQVGTELKVDLDGSDPDGGALAYRYAAADLTDLDGHAMVTVSPSGAGVFRWTPLAADVGQHAFDFTVSDGSHDTTVTITIDVKSAIGSATAPVFRQPLGTGTTMDMTKQTCVDLDIVIEDEDTARVAIAQEDPVIDGATLTQTDGLTAKWHWCPTREQAAENRYTLVLSADDSDNPKTIKNYLVVLRANGDGSGCPGAAPVIVHTAADQTTSLDLRLTARVTDDKGLKDAPLFYYSTTPPATPPNLSTMTQLSTSLVSGAPTDATYTTDVPNPVASAPAGSAVTLYYVFVADDDDDTTGTCDHTTQSQTFQMMVTSSGTVDQAACSTCSSDTQCGAGGECVYIGSTGDSYCLPGCGGGCPTGYSCSAATIYSVDGASGYQCVPQSGTCEAPTGECDDDTWEDNDTRSEASHNPTLTPDTYDLVSCPSTTGSNSDDDWFKIEVAQDSRIDLQLAGDAATDLDLHLYHSDGTVVTSSTSSNPDEQINTCLPAATYYVKVNAYGHARNEYFLSYDLTAESCSTSCVDDANEDDDTYSQARFAYAGYSSTGNEICPNDDDWYHVSLFTGDHLSVDLTFTQSNPQQDLDIHLYDGSFDLTPCDPSQSNLCQVTNGQGASSNEHMGYDVPAGCESGCDYYVVARGYNGASNSYGIAINIQ